MAEACGMRFPVKVYTRQDEFTGQGYQKNQAVTHIDLGVWADVLLIAPVDALTIGKMANGLPDNLVASTYLAWPMEKPIILAPAMNTRMWEHPAVQENIAKLRKWHQDCLTLFVPVTKRLACGETGVGAMADIGDIVRAVEFYLS